MAFKMKGAPLMDTSKKHGTNKNFMKSGMKNADGTASSGAPFLGGIGKKLMDPLGLFGRGKGKGGACPSPAQQAPAPRPAEPTGTPAPAAAAPAPAAAEEAPAATMKKGLMKGGAPKKKKKQKGLMSDKQKAAYNDAKGLTKAKLKDLGYASYKRDEKTGKLIAGPKIKKGAPMKKEGAPMAKKNGAPLKGLKEVGEGFKTIGRTIMPSSKNIKKQASNVKEGFRQLFTGDRTDSRVKKTKKKGAPLNKGFDSLPASVQAKIKKGGPKMMKKYK